MKSIMTKVAIAMLMSMAIAPVFAQAEKHESAEQNKSAVLRINRTRQQVTMVTSDATGKKDTTVATRTRVCDVADSIKLERYEAKRAGKTPETVYFDGHNKDITGRKLSRPFVEVGGGLNWLFENKELRPELVLNFGWESRYFLLMATGFMSWKSFNDSDKLTDHGIVEGAEASGRYNTFGGMLGGGPKLWSSNDFNSYLALIGQVGYGYTKTDGDAEDIRFSSSFYGLKWRGFARFHYGFNSHWGVSIDAGVTNTVVNNHDSDQSKGSITGEVTATLGYSF